MDEAHTPQAETVTSATAVRNWDAWTIALQGELDTAAVTRLQHEITDALTCYDRIVVDLRDVSVLSTAAITLLCCTLRRVHRKGARFVIADAGPAAHRTLELCDLPGVQFHPPKAPLDVLGSTQRRGGVVTAHTDQQWVAA